MLVLHDDGAREYAYGPAQGLPETKIGRFTPELYDEAIKDGWIVVSMKNDWKRIFAFELGPNDARPRLGSRSDFVIYNAQESRGSGRFEARN